MIVLALLWTAAAAGAGWWLGSRELRNTRRALYAPRAVPSEPLKSSIIAAVQELPEPTDARREDQVVLEDTLRMVADQHGADVASLWAVTEGEESFPEAVAWSAGDAPPELSERARGLVAWTGESELIAIDRSDDAPEAFLAVAPVREGKFRGALALSFTSAHGSISSRPTLKAWLPRHARRLGTLFEVLRTRGEVARVNHRLRFSMRAAMALQNERDPLKLVVKLVEDTLVVAGCEWSMLVRWQPHMLVGDVRASTREFTDENGARLVRLGAVPAEETGPTAGAGTVVGDACLDGAMLVYPDVRPSEGQLLIDGLRLPRAGSLLVVPVRRDPNFPSRRGPGSGKDEPVVGVLVCGHSWRGALSDSDARQTRDLAVIAAGALAAAWDMEMQREFARTDALTGLPNRRHFDEKFAERVAEVDREEQGSMALIIADIDLFKAVNDTYGHETGDEVLKAIAGVLKAERRTNDVVARLGGEELAVILPKANEAAARDIAERMRIRVEGLRVRAGVETVTVTASFGVAVYNSYAGDSGTLFERADKAMYAAKRSGRNRVEVAPAGMPAGAARHRR